MPFLRTLSDLQDYLDFDHEKDRRIGRLMRHTCLHVVSCGDKGKKALNSNIAEEKFDFV